MKTSMVKMSYQLTFSATYVNAHYRQFISHTVAMSLFTLRLSIAPCVCQGIFHAPLKHVYNYKLATTFFVHILVMTACWCVPSPGSGCWLFRPADWHGAAPAKRRDHCGDGVWEGDQLAAVPRSAPWQGHLQAGQYCCQLAGLLKAWRLLSTHVLVVK